MSVHSMVVNLTAKTSVFDRKMRQSSKTVRSFGSTAANVGRSIRRMATGMLAAAGVAGMGYMIRQTMKSIDATGKLARRLDISTEALVGFQHAAKISGIETEAFNKSLSIMARRLGEEQVRAGEARYGLEMLGLKAKELTEMGTEKAFLTIAEAISKLENQSKKAYAAYTLLGRQGMNMLNMFERGASGINKLRKEAERLGITFNAIDAAKIELANDAFTRMKAAFTGLVQVLTIELSPYIEAFADSLTKAGIAGQNMGKAIVDAIEYVSIGVGRLIDDFRDLGKTINSITHPFSRMGAGAKAIASLNRPKSKAGSIEDFFATLRANADARAKLALETPKGAGIDIETINAFEKLKIAADRLTEAMKSPIEKFKDMRAEYDKMLKANFITQEVYDKALKKAAETLFGGVKAARKAGAGDTGQFLELGQGVSVSGLSIGAIDPALQKMDEQKIELQKQTSLLEQIANKEVLSF